MIPVPMSIMAPAPTVSITFKEELQVLLLLIESKQFDKQINYFKSLNNRKKEHLYISY